MNTMKLAPIAVLATFASVGCTASSSQEHLLQSVTDGGLTVEIEGLAGPRSVAVYSIVVAPAEGEGGGEGGPVFSGVECRLFEDLDGDHAFDETADRSIGVFAGSGEAHAPWTIGPLSGDFDAGTPCLETLATIEGDEPRRQSFAIETE